MKQIYQNFIPPNQNQWPLLCCVKIKKLSVGKSHNKNIKLINYSVVLYRVNELETITRVSFEQNLFLALLLAIIQKLEKCIPSCNLVIFKLLSFNLIFHLKFIVWEFHTKIFSQASRKKHRRSANARKCTRKRWEGGGWSWKMKKKWRRWAWRSGGGASTWASYAPSSVTMATARSDSDWIKSICLTTFDRFFKLKNCNKVESQ